MGAFMEGMEASMEAVEAFMNLRKKNKQAVQETECSLSLLKVL